MRLTHLPSGTEAPVLQAAVHSEPVGGDPETSALGGSVRTVARSTLPGRPE